MYYQVAIILARLIVPFSILRSPFYGILASLLIDSLDVLLFNLTGGVPSWYQPVDKALDLYYYTIAFYKSLSWEKLPKQVARITYIVRLVGVCLFELTIAHLYLFFFPNIFEMWFTFWAARERFFPKFVLTTRKLVLILICLAIPKMLQEYLLHWPHPEFWEMVYEKSKEPSFYRIITGQI
jgi:hypothetical protein